MSVAAPRMLSIPRTLANSRLKAYTAAVRFSRWRAESANHRSDGEIADDQRDDQHDGERDEVLRIADRKGEVRRDKEKVESAHTRHGCEMDGPRPQAAATPTTPRDTA